MASLSGNTIQDTYDGLLKLEDSTQGITSSFQNITDGLGNETGVKIKENFFLTPNMFAQTQHKYEYYGLGISNTLTFTPGVSLYASANRKMFQYAVDLGYYSYSAITLNLSINTANDETYKLRFYNTQFVQSVGLVPYQAISEVITLNNTGSTGEQTYTFANPLTIPSGFYFIVWEAYNNTSPGSQLQSRYRGASFPQSAFTLLDMLGKTRWEEVSSGNFYWNGFGSRSNSGASYPIYDITGFPDSLSEAEIISSRLSATPGTSTPGFILHTIF